MDFIHAWYYSSRRLGLLFTWVQHTARTVEIQPFVWMLYTRISHILLDNTGVETANDDHDI